MEKAFLKTPLGLASIEGDENGIQSISISDEQELTSDEVPFHLKDCVLQLQEYFAGERKKFNLKLKPQGTEFQQKVWREIQEIPYGKTISYLELSLKIGDIKKVRAVAAANGKNPLWIVVPCHRVIGSDGSLTGYAGGLWRKKCLLDHENPPAQKSLF